MHAMCLAALRDQYPWDTVKPARLKNDVNSMRSVLSDANNAKVTNLHRHGQEPFYEQRVSFLKKLSCHISGWNQMS